MSQQIQELIDKIKSEAIAATQEKNKEMESQAKIKAQSIVDQAKAEAAQLIEKAMEGCKKREESTLTALKQAARDTILELRKEITRILNSVISTSVRAALTPDALAGILEIIIRDFLNNKSTAQDIRVTLNPADLEKMKNGLLSRLQETFKNPISFQSGEDVGGGFSISFDNGKSSFDFTDESLSEFLSVYLNVEVSSLLKEGARKS